MSSQPILIAEENARTRTFLAEPLQAAGNRVLDSKARR